MYPLSVLAPVAGMVQATDAGPISDSTTGGTATAYI